jgi:hypothetical protein
MGMSDAAVRHVQMDDCGVTLVGYWSTGKNLIRALREGYKKNHDGDSFHSSIVT